MANIIPFESASLPAIYTGVTNELASGLFAGFPVISIKSKVFALVRGGVREMITNPTTGDPAGSLEVVIVKANPALSKVFYLKGYVEGSEEKPDCYSYMGDVPGADASKPQCASCAACPQNQWGSKISDSGEKLKACSDSRRMAIAAPDAINDPMLLRVPAASLKALKGLGDQISARGVASYAVVVRIGFDYSVSHPALTFKPIGLVDAATMQEVAAARESELVNAIVGISPMASTPVAAPTPAPAPVVVAPVAPPPAPVAAAPAAPKPGRPKKTTSLGSSSAAPVAAPVAAVAPAPVAARPPIEVADESALAAELAAMGLLDSDD